MLKREWGAESNGKLPHLFIPSKTATQVPEFAIEDLPLGRIAALVHEFAVKDLPLGRTLMMMMMIIHERTILITTWFVCLLICSRIPRTIFYVEPSEMWKNNFSRLPPIYLFVLMSIRAIIQDVIQNHTISISLTYNKFFQAVKTHF